MFSKAVEKVIELGFEPCQHNFCIALTAVSGQTQRQWDHKRMSFGVSEGDVLLAFKKLPKCMYFLEKKIMSTFNFLVNKMGWEPAEVIRVPLAFGYTLKKRTMPRCLVVRVLQLKGLAKKIPYISSILVQPERNFIRAYVVRQQKRIPQWQILQGEMSICELGFAFEEKSWTKDA
uniref:Uncharacterized protein MANES_04G038800 n=1 Tax=Rhizophora mucronata TaxID=61149 RepID=A0A2P2IKL3_RHIMU